MNIFGIILIDFESIFFINRSVKLY